MAGAAPEWMSEKAVAIGHYFVASGMYVVLGHPLYVEGSENVHRLLAKRWKASPAAGSSGSPIRWWRRDKMLEHIETQARRAAHQREEGTQAVRHEIEAGTRMSKIIASSAIRGAHQIVSDAEDVLARAIAAKGADCAGGIPGYGLLAAGDLLAAGPARGPAVGHAAGARRVPQAAAAGSRTTTCGCRISATRWMPAWRRCSPSRSSKPAST